MSPIATFLCWLLVSFSAGVLVTLLIAPRLRLDVDLTWHYADRVEGSATRPVRHVDVAVGVLGVVHKCQVVPPDPLFAPAYKYSTTFHVYEPLDEGHARHQNDGNRDRRSGR